MINRLSVKEVLNMLWFTKNKDITCYALQEAWRLVDELASMGAEQTANGWNVAEYANHIEDSHPAIADRVADIGAEQTATGMAVSESACNLEDQIISIAEATGCKLAPRP